MIKSITELIAIIKKDFMAWKACPSPWFRGESGNEPPLCPKITSHTAHEENYLLQSFRRQAGGLANVPPREYTDMWLFLAQHYGVPTRLLDWTEGALHALYFALNRKADNPRIYMLNPQRLNELAGAKVFFPNYPLSWVKGGAIYVAFAWQNRDLNDHQQREAVEIGLNLNIPLAFPATYQDQRMIAQRSCFTIHGKTLKPLNEILENSCIVTTDCLHEYKVDIRARIDLLRELSILGISAATIFPDLDHLAEDLTIDMKGF